MASFTTNAIFNDTPRGATNAIVTVVDERGAAGENTFLD